MSRNQQIGYAAIALGIVIALVSALADTLGLGSTEGVFGTRQIIGVVVGIVILVAGAYFAFMYKGRTA